MVQPARWRSWAILCLERGGVSEEWGGGVGEGEYLVYFA